MGTCDLREKLFLHCLLWTTEPKRQLAVRGTSVGAGCGCCAVSFSFRAGARGGVLLLLWLGLPHCTAWRVQWRGSLAEFPQPASSRTRNSRNSRRRATIKPPRRRRRPLCMTAHKSNTTALSQRTPAKRTAACPQLHNFPFGGESKQNPCAMEFRDAPSPLRLAWWLQNIGTARATRRVIFFWPK